MIRFCRHFDEDIGSYFFLLQKYSFSEMFFFFRIGFKSQFFYFTLWDTNFSLCFFCGISTTSRNSFIREACTSRHHGDQIRTPLKPLEYHIDIVPKGTIGLDGLDGAPIVQVTEDKNPSMDEYKCHFCLTLISTLFSRVMDFVRFFFFQSEK